LTDLVDIQINVLKIGLNCLKTSSPLLAIINHFNVLRAETMTYEEVLESDMQLAKMNFLEKDFYEGVDNLLVKKGKVPPKWMHSSLKEVPQDLVDKMLNTRSTLFNLDLDFL
jgi:hypothetical protein